MNLGKRLTKVANMVQPAGTMADVGCDHGYLSVYLIEQKKCQHVIAMDINKGPLQKARENIQKFGYGDYIETRLSNGLDKLKPGEAEGYVCAGMGGPLALQILWNNRDKVRTMKQIILQPQSELWLVRRTLKQWGFIVEEEDIELEDSKYYFMMRIRPGSEFCMEDAPEEDTTFLIPQKSLLHDATEAVDMSEEALKERAYELFAEELIKSRNEILRDYICKEVKRISDVYESLLKQGNSMKSRIRKETVEKELAIHRWALRQYETK